jgi:hypothetical protein
LAVRDTARRRRLPSTTCACPTSRRFAQKAALAAGAAVGRLAGFEQTYRPTRALEPALDAAA